MCNYYKYNMPTFKEKSEVDDARVKSRHYDDLGLKTGWNFRCKALTGWLEGKMKLFCTSRFGRSFSSSLSWNRSRNSRTAVALGGR